MVLPPRIDVHFLLLLLLEAMADLDTAIHLALDAPQHKKTLSLALTQRAALRRFLGEKDCLPRLLP